MTPQLPRIVQYPFSASLQGAVLDSYNEQRRGGRSFTALEIRALEPGSSELFEREGKVYERLKGTRFPIRLHFAGVSGLNGSDFFQSLGSLRPDDPARIIGAMLSWQQPERGDMFYLFFFHRSENLMFFAENVRYERLSEESIPFTLERDWCSPPPMPEGPVPRPRDLHQRFGGDPITFQLGSQTHDRRLFIGGVEIQPDERPQVDVVFNVSEEPSKWLQGNQTDPRDRWDNKGEGSDGMSLGVIREEADWVIEHLRRDKRVLVHCAAGMNRSVTICCAALILLEGLTAEQALARVREHHPWASPDSGHWLRLRWLAKTNRG